MSFAINHAGWPSAIGKFRAFSGDIIFDKGDVKKSSVKVEIDAAASMNPDGQVNCMSSGFAR